MKLNTIFKSTLIIVFLLFISGCSSSSQVTKNSQESIKISMEDISTQAKFFKENVDGKDIKFFAIKDEQGNVKVAFDACDVCGGLKGYHQEAEDMVCNNCGRHFKISQLGSTNVNGGGCWPSYLRHKEENGNIIITTNDISKGGKFFA